MIVEVDHMPKSFVRRDLPWIIGYLSSVPVYFLVSMPPKIIDPVPFGRA
jgi:hypothetical protein